MCLAGHPSQGCFGLQSHCALCYFFNQASFYPSDFSFRNGILWKECVVLPHLCKRTFMGAYVLTPARFIRPINNWGASEDFPALKNVIDRCAVTLRLLRTNQKKLSGRGKESALGFGSEEDAK
ncbi:hypothetical protein TNCV_127051 [Trichonephila clavipes]|nr:hypothetical protein TNCV_127051 [Trichonephila clavipes]